jgi:hypothetical protein
MKRQGAAMVLAPFFFFDWSEANSLRNEARALCVWVGRATRPRHRSRVERLCTTPSRRGGIVTMAKKAAKGGKKKGGKKR